MVNASTFCSPCALLWCAPFQCIGLLHSLHTVTAKSVLQARKSRERVLESATKLNSVVLQLEAAAAQLRVAQTIQSSTTLLKGMQSLMSIPQLRSVCVNMSKEMMKAGMIEEALNDVMAVDDDMEVEAEGEVDKILQEVVGDILSKAGTAKAREAAKKQEEAKVDVAEPDALAARLANLDS